MCVIMWHSHLNDTEIPKTKRFIPKGFELGTTLSQPNRSIGRRKTQNKASHIWHIKIKNFKHKNP